MISRLVLLGKNVSHNVNTSLIARSNNFKFTQNSFLHIFVPSGQSDAIDGESNEGELEDYGDELEDPAFEPYPTYKYVN